MNSSDLVSVVIPCYNQGPFLEECLVSLRSQTYKPIEIILVDDGSGPETAATIDHLLETYRFRLIRKPNGGLSSARNAGAQEAAGRYVLPLDADNYLSENAVELLVDALQSAQSEAPQVMFIYQDKVLFGLEDRYVPHQPYNLYRLLTDNFSDACSLIDRRIFDWGFRYNEKMRAGYEDWEFHLRLAVYGIEGRRLPGKTFFYRRWGYSMVNDADQKRQQLHRHIQDENAALFIPAIEQGIKTAWAPGVTVMGAAEPLEQTLQDVEWLSASPADSVASISRALGKYLFIMETAPTVLQADRALLEKLAAWSEWHDSIHAARILDPEGKLAAYWIRARFLTEFLAPNADLPWNHLWEEVQARTDVWTWSSKRGGFTNKPDAQETVAEGENRRNNRRISRWVKDFGKRHIAPRVGFDQSYEIFYHAYQTFRLTRKVMRRRTRLASPVSPIESLELSPTEAGLAIDRGFRHYTPVNFSGGDANAD